MKVVFLVFTIFFSPTLFAYDTWPEAKTFSISEWDRIETFRDVGSEVDSHRITYGKSVAQDFQFLEADKIFDLSIGSMSSKQFYNDYRLKLKSQMTDKLSFHLMYYDHGDFEQEVNTLLLSLKYFYNTNWGMSFIGGTQFQKENNDIGLGFFQYSQLGKFNLTWIQSDFQRNDRRVSQIEWLKNYQPVSWTLTWTHPSEKIHFYSQYEEPIRAKNVTTNEIKKYSRKVFGVFSKKDFSNNYEWSQRLQFDDQREEASSTFQNAQRYMISQYLQKDFIDFKLEFGAHYFKREFDLPDGRVHTNSILPAVWLHKNNYSVGYDFTYFNRRVSNPTLVEARNIESAENRLNFAYNWSFQQNTQLSLLFTADLDKFGTSETWEGGAGKFSVLF